MLKLYLLSCFVVCPWGLWWYICQFKQKNDIAFKSNFQKQIVFLGQTRWSAMALKNAQSTQI
jgi:hypothetical protein